MTEFNDNDLEFVARNYRSDKFDTRKALRRFHTETDNPVHRRWWMTAAAAAASIVVLFAAGYGIRSWVQQRPEPAPTERPALNPDVAVTHEFVYDNVPVEAVLAELSTYYHCTLTTAPTDKKLTATFPDDNIDYIVGLIETALDIQITVER